MNSVARRACLSGLLLLLIGQLIQARPDSSPGIVASGLDCLDAVMASYIETGQLAGLVVLVRRADEEVFHRAYGLRDRESGAPMSKDSIFRIASMSKAIVSVGVLQLQEQGRLLINDPVGRYLPEYRDTTVAVPKEAGGYDVVPANRPITIRDLLTHTAGIGYGYGPAMERWAEAGIQGWYFAHRSEPIRETVRRMARLPFDAQPGQQFVYGYNTDILGAVVAVVSGQSLDAYLREWIFEPLDMHDTYFYLPEAKRNRLAVVYSAGDDGSIDVAPGVSAMNGQGEYVDGPRMNFSGGAGLLSTAHDYGRFLQAMLNGGTLGKTRLLSPSSVRLMTVDHLGEIGFRPGMGFGLGFSVVKDVGLRGLPGSVGEFAWGGAYHTTYWVDPQEKLVVVYMTQLLPTGGLDDHRKLRALIYQALN